MPKIQVNGTEINYEDRGSGEETIVFSHGLLWSTALFDNQVNSLKEKFRCISFDFRGQGKSEITDDGYDMDTLAVDAAELIKKLKLGPCHFVGLSMGGFIGLRLGIREPDLIKSLILLDTTAHCEPAKSARKYRLLNFIARWFGLSLVADQAMAVMFGRKFLNDKERSGLKREMKTKLLSNDRIGITRAIRGVIERDGIYDEIGSITAPTLILVGDGDVATPIKQSEKMHDKIKGSELKIIPGAGHSSPVEEPEFVNIAIETFLSKVCFS